MPAPSHRAALNAAWRSECVDVRDRGKLRAVFAEFQPEVVFHLAAQPLVRFSYAEPAATFEVNLQGTVNVLECCRTTASVRAAVIVTTDKCYENPETGRPFNEDDRLGGFDPYSASKGCAEIAVSSYRRAFFAPEGRVACASARAGNVVGGGDWAADRLVPDLARGAAAGRRTALRNPASVRPWQHVLEPLSGYLLLGAKLFREGAKYAGAWNFGPSPDDTPTVAEVAAELAGVWDKFAFDLAPEPDAPHEAGCLRLDCAKADRELGWRGVWTAREGFRRTGQWYRDYYESGAVNTAADLAAYCAAAQRKGLTWTR